MLIISRQGIENLVLRLNEKNGLDSCRDEVYTMLEIKSSHLWRADSAVACCGWQLGARLAQEVQILEDTLDALEAGDTVKASALLKDYLGQMG